MKHAPVSLKNIFLIFMLALLLPVSLYAQKKDNQGKEFYVAFAENQGGQVNQNEDQNFFALFITSKVPTSGRIQVTGIGYDVTFTTTPGTITTIELPDGKTNNDPTVECTIGEQILKGMAVHITSDEEIAVYGMNHKLYSSDAFMALPVDVLGTEYRTLNYQTSQPNGSGNKGLPGEFWVVAVADSTNVTIIPKAMTRNGSPAGMPIKALMYKGDVFLVQGDDQNSKNDLTGSLIESDQPIAVLSGHVRTEIPQGFKNKNSPSTSRDHLVEQLPPVSAWGDSALVVRYNESLPDLVRIVSSEDANVLSINGAVVTTLQAGDFWEIKQLTTPISIQATSPILVGQYMHTSVYGIGDPQHKPYGDPAYSLIFPVEQFDTAYTFMLVENPTFTGNYVNVVADPTGIASMTLDGALVTGKPYNASFLPIPGSNYVYTQISFDASKQGAHNIYSTKPFGITVYALGEVDSYAYPGGTLLKTITPFKTVDLVIDFGDRVLTPPGPPYSSTGHAVGWNKWDTTVYLQNISSDPYAIDGFVSKGGNAPANFNVTRYPKSIAASVRDSMTIEFTPDRAYIEMQTTIKALTPHLQAYVVQVKGRGILENAQIYSDSNTTLPIDTLDFGVLQATDVAKDSFVYVANKGVVDLTIDLDNIIGPNVADFTIPNIPGARTIKSRPVIPPYVLHPYSKLLALQDSSAKITLRFTPTGLPNGFYQAEYDISTQGQQRKVILLAHIKTILKSTVLNATFDTAFICQNQIRSLFVDNPNDFQITVNSVDLGGLNPADFSVITPIPLAIPPSSRAEIQLQYSPSVPGTSSAQAIVSFDLPKGFADTLKFTAFGDQLSSRFWARNNVHILPTEEVLFPIYAKTPMHNFGSTSFVLTISYDPSHLVDDPFGFVQTNTLTEFGEWIVNNDSSGYSKYSYRTLDGSIVSGGSDTEPKPLIYLKFKSNLNPADDAVHFHQDIDINYKVDFDHSPVPSGCVLSVAPVGRIILDSTCETVYLLNDTILYPQESYIEPVRPNPVFNGRAKFVIDVPQTDVVHLDVMDMFGNKAAVILDESRKPGTYEIQWDASNMNPGMYYVRLQTAGQSKLRKMVIVR